MPPDFTELDDLQNPRITIDDQLKCEGPLTHNEILDVLKTCKNGKSPGSDGFPAEFYKFFLA